MVYTHLLYSTNHIAGYRFRNQHVLVILWGETCLYHTNMQIQAYSKSPILGMRQQLEIMSMCYPIYWIKPMDSISEEKTTAKIFRIWIIEQLKKTS